jgi:hypothetical protein
MIYVFIKNNEKIFRLKRCAVLQVGQELLSMEKPISDRKQRVVLVKENNFHLF